MTMNQPADLKALCVIGRAIETVPVTHRAALERIVSQTFAEGGLGPDDAAILMLEAGLQSSASAITRHRRGVCSCKKARLK